MLRYDDKDNELQPPTVCDLSIWLHRSDLNTEFPTLKTIILLDRYKNYIIYSLFTLSLRLYLFTEYFSVMTMKHVNMSHTSHDITSVPWDRRPAWRHSQSWERIWAQHPLKKKEQKEARHDYIHL